MYSKYENHYFLLYLLSKWVHYYPHEDVLIRVPEAPSKPTGRSLEVQRHLFLAWLALEDLKSHLSSRCYSCNGPVTKSSIFTSSKLHKRPCSCKPLPCDQFPSVVGLWDHDSSHGTGILEKDHSRVRSLSVKTDSCSIQGNFYNDDTTLWITFS